MVFLTARTDEIDRVVGLELGADDYVAKPFSPRELVREGAHHPAPCGEGRYRRRRRCCHSWSTKGKRQIRFYGQPLELSRYEYGLLKTLVERPGHVYSRDVLLDKVWDTSSESLDRTVDAHVKTLARQAEGGCTRPRADPHAPRQRVCAGGRPARQPVSRRTNIFVGILLVYALGVGLLMYRLLADIDPRYRESARGVAGRDGTPACRAGRAAQR